MDAATTTSTERWSGKRERGCASSRREEPVDRSGDERTRGERVDGGRERWGNQGVEGTSIKNKGLGARAFEFFCLLVASSERGWFVFRKRIASAREESYRV